jgi:hypothetical protein
LRIFIAHPERQDELAGEIARCIREAGHEATPGAHISPAFSRSSFADPSVAQALRSSDVLVALMMDDFAFEYLPAEAAFFSGHHKGKRTIVVTTERSEQWLPPFLREQTVLHFKEDAPATAVAICREVSTIRLTHERATRQIFLSYARLDVEAARQLYDELTSAGYNVWFDQVSLRGGQEWETAIERAISDSHVFMPLLSSSSIQHRGHFQKELRKSFSVAEEVPEGATFIVPVLLDRECVDSLPQQVRKYHCLEWAPGKSWGLDAVRAALDFALSPPSDSGKTFRKR